MFNNANYQGIVTLGWDTSGTQYHALWRFGTGYWYYRVSDLVLKWTAAFNLYAGDLSEYKNGFESA